MVATASFWASIIGFKLISRRITAALGACTGSRCTTGPTMMPFGSGHVNVWGAV